MKILLACRFFYVAWLCKLGTWLAGCSSIFFTQSNKVLISVWKYHGPVGCTVALDIWCEFITDHLSKFHQSAFNEFSQVHINLYFVAVLFLVNLFEKYVSSRSFTSGQLF
jgi:hypothetical protein